MKNILTSLFFFFLFLTAMAQDASVQNLQFVPVYTKKKTFKANDYAIAAGHSFYLYRNAVYQIYPSTGGLWLIRVTDIRNDSIYYEHYGPQQSFRKDSLFRLHPTEIGTIMVSSFDFPPFSNPISLQGYLHRFTRDSAAKAFPARQVRLSSPDGTRSDVADLAWYVRRKGVVPVFKKCDKPFYYDSSANLDCEDGRALFGPPPYPNVTRDVIWFTPSGAQNINGVNIGLLSMGLGNKPLKISGMNVNVDLLSVLATMYLPFLPWDSSFKVANHPDTIAYSKAKDKIAGLSISAGGVISEGRIHGIAVNGSVCFTTVVKGICITGLVSKIEEFQGLTIGGISNTSFKGRGLQIGLVNRCKNLRGVQVGLWNVNSKRKLPLINWNFRNG